MGQYGNEHKIKACGFIYPVSADKWGDKNKPYKYDKMRIMGTQIDFYVFFVIVPTDNSVSKVDFHSEFSQNIELLIASIKEITG